MLHWNSWWLPPTDRGDARSSDDLVALQTGLWERWLDAHRSWWTMYLAHFPTMPWPPAGIVAPPEPVEPLVTHKAAQRPPAAATRKPKTESATATAPVGTRPQHARKR